jgi:hypothetical protein
MAKKSPISGFSSAMSSSLLGFLLVSLWSYSCRAGLPGPGASDEQEDAESVTLATGKKLEGKIVEYREGVHVIIRLADGRTPVILWKDVLAVDSKNFRFRRGDRKARQEDSEEQPETPGRTTRFGRDGAGIEIDGDLVEAEARRKAWMERGGALGMLSLQASFSAIKFPTTTVGIGGCSLETSISGFGYGSSIRAGFMALQLPSAGGGTWWSFKMATGLDFSSATTTSESTNRGNCGSFGASGSGSTSSQSSILQVPVNIGFLFGLGSGRVGEWSGLVLGISWAPSYSYFIPTGGTGEGNFSYYGADVSFDFATLKSTLEKNAGKAHFRLNVFVLPPVSSKDPFFINAGIGAVWY